MRFNETFWLEQWTLSDLPQQDIARCPNIQGDPLLMVMQNKDVPESVRLMLTHLQWPEQRRYKNVILRPQDCRGSVPPRSGTFWHLDANLEVGFGNVQIAPTWDDFRLIVVSFGGVSGTMFVREPFELDYEGSPDVNYPRFAGLVPRDAPVIEAQPCQVVHYTSRDFHMASERIRAPGWRLLVIGVESDYLSK